MYVGLLVQIIFDGVYFLMKPLKMKPLLMKPLKPTYQYFKAVCFVNSSWIPNLCVISAISVHFVDLVILKDNKLWR